MSSPDCYCDTWGQFWVDLETEALENGLWGYGCYGDQDEFLKWFKIKMKRAREQDEILKEIAAKAGSGMCQMTAEGKHLFLKDISKLCESLGIDILGVTYEDKTEKPLFIPLKTEFYDSFMSGEKCEEFRAYGPRWNEKVCRVGRPVLLSKGYGKHSRATSKVTSFEKRHGHDFISDDQGAILACFGSLNIEIAVIGLWTPVEISNA